MKTVKLLTLVASLLSLSTFAPHGVAADEAADTAAAGTVAAVVQPEDKAADGGNASGASQYVDDATITTRVKTSLLADKNTSGTAINVETENGTVKLSGNARTAEEKNRAIELARQIPGVKDVRDMIQVH